MLRALLAALLLLLTAGSPFATVPRQDADQADFERAVRSQLRRHRYLSRVPMQWIWDHEPFLFLVQVPPGEDEARASEVASGWFEWLNALHGRFTEQYAGPMGLRLRSDRFRLPVIVLATPGDYAECLRVAGPDLLQDRPAWYSVLDQFLYLRGEPAPPGSEEETTGRHFEMHAAAHLLVHGYGPRMEGEPKPFWFWEGLADDLAAHRGSTAAGFEEWEISGPALSELVERVQDPQARAACLLPLGIFLRQSSFASVASTCARRSDEVGGSTFDENAAASTYAAMASVLFHYLTIDAPGQLPTKMKAYTERAIKNRLGEKPLKEYLGDIDLEELERDLWQYAWMAARTKWPTRQFDTAQLGAFLAERGGPGTVGAAITESGPAMMLGVLTDPDARLALAIAHARAGSFERGVTILEAALKEGVSERIERELARLRAWIEQREAFFVHLAGSDKKFSFDHGGSRVVAKVEAVKDGRVHFGENRRKIESLALGEIAPVELSRRVRESKWGFEAGWVTGYPAVVTFDPKAKRFLRGEAPELALLVEDLASDYPGRREAIEAAEQLIELVDVASGETADDARKTLEGIKTVWARRGTVPFLANLEGDLHALAERSLARVFEEGGLEEVLNGEVQQRADGGIRVRYDFSDEAQLRDWILEETPGRRHAGYPELERTDSYFRCTGGVLSGAGQTSLIHRLEFEGRHSIGWKCRMQSGASEEARRKLTFEVSFCNGERGQRIAAVNSLGLDVIDFKTGKLNRQTPEKPEIFFDTYYDLLLDHNGVRQVTLRRDGKELFSDEHRGNVRGGVELWLHSDCIVDFDDVEITGEATEESRLRLRDSWVAREVAALGL